MNRIVALFVGRLACMVICLIFVLFAGVNFVWAEEKEAETESETSKLAPIVVTAGKRTESITNLNASISVMSDEEIEVERIESIDDFQARFANVHVQSAAGATNSFISIRGIVGQTVPMTPSGVGIYVDDVTLIDPLSNLLSSAYFFDLEQIEVLRGPQGTLYGRNAEAGVLIIKTKDPEHKFTAKILGEAGNYNKYMGTAVVNVPLVKDKVASRISASYLKRDGYRDNVYLGNTAADVDEYSIRGKLLWDISPKTKLLFATEHNHVRDGAQDLVPFTIAGPDWDESQINTDIDGHENRDMSSYSLHFSHELHTAEIVSITAYRDGKESTLGDPDYWSFQTGYSQFDLHQKQFSQELRLVSNQNAQPWKWLVGAYYFYNDMDFNSLYHMGPEGVEMEMDMTTTGDGSNMGAALFGDVEYRFSQGIRLGAGIRGQYYEDKLKSTRTISAMGMTLDQISGDISNNYDQLLGKVSLAYDFAENMTVYGLVSQGSRAGGIVSLAQTDKMHYYDPETAINYEIGFKSQLPNNLGYFDLALFVTDIQDLHVSTTGTGGFQYVSNAGEARNIGGEAQLNLNLFKYLTVNASLGYVDAELQDYKDGGQDFSNNKVPRVPDLTGFFSLQYRREVFSGTSFLARAGYQYVGETYWDLANTNSEDPYSLVNATLGLEGGWWRFYLWGKNLTDEKYVRTAVMWGDLVVGGYGAPMTYGATLQFIF